MKSEKLHSARSVALTTLVTIVVALGVFKLFATNACVMNRWATYVRAAQPQTLTDEDREILEHLPAGEQAANISDAVDELMGNETGITFFENAPFDADGNAGKAATNFGNQVAAELENRGLFAQYTYRMERKGAKSAIPIMHQDQMTPYVRGVWETICEEVNKFFVSRPSTGNFDDPEMQKRVDERAKELKESKNEKAALSFETASAWYKEQKDVIEQKVHAANADGHKFRFLTLNVWFAAGSGKRLMVLDRDGCAKAEAKFGNHPNYPGNDSFYMKHEVLKWAIANIPEHLYLTKPKQGVAFWGVGFPVDVLKKTPRSVVRGNTLYGVFHSGYVVKDNTSVESGEDRYSVMGPRERFAPRRPKVLLAQERGKRLAAAAAKELEKTARTSATKKRRA